MKYDRRPIQQSQFTDTKSKENEEVQRDRYWRQSSYDSRSSCCPTPLLVGMTIGALLASVALSSILTLYLVRPGVCTTSATTSTTTSSTTTSSTSTSSTSSTSSTTTSTATTTSTTAAFNINLVRNGDAETGSCQLAGNITTPTGWSFNGPITQLIYNNPTAGCLTSSDPGPTNRGRCYFYGQLAASTSMWQTINLTNQVSPVLIDSQTVKFNLSAWLGGYYNQDDTAIVSVTFTDVNNQLLGNSTSLGPVYAVDRSSVTSLIFMQDNGIVPAGARSMTVFVTLTRSRGTWNQGSVDNIALFLYP